MTKNQTNYKTAMRFSIVAERDETYGQGAQIRCSMDAERESRKIFTQTEIWEEMHILLLNKAHKVIGHAMISQGGTSNTVCDPKLVAFYAVNSLASGIIMVHNHPSGNPTPSETDRKMTTAIKDALKLLDINLLDHIILTSSCYRSLSDECMI